MRDDALGAARIDITVEHVAEASRVGHRPTLVNLAQVRLGPGSDQ